VIVADERTTRRVGLISLAALVVVIAFFVFIWGRIEWGSHTRIKVAFHHVGGMREGAPFVVGGRTIGNVESIMLARAGSGDDEGVVATVAIDAREARRLDPAGDVFIASRGMLSERYLELGPGPDRDTPAPGFHEGQLVVGRDPPSLDRVLQRTWDNLTDLREFVGEVKPELDALRTQIDALRAHLDPASPSALPDVAELAPLFVDLGELADEVRLLRDTGLGGDAGLAHLGEVLQRTSIVIASARGSLATLDAASTKLRASLASLRARLDAKGADAVTAIELAIDRVQADIAKLDPLLKAVADLQARLARGEGTLMKLANDPEFPEDAKELGKILKRHPWKIIDHPRDRK
jgi:MlaD protein